ncbi:MAG: GNAT family N-acetyltransferase [Gemmatimonadota bacterium]
MASGSISRISIRQATPADAELLAALGSETFQDTFGPENTDDDMAMYLGAAFGAEQQLAELSDPRHTVFFAEREVGTVGYVMLREGPPPDGVKEPDVLEIVRLYSVKRSIGSGVGAALMQRSLDEAAARGKSAIWLGVWEHNARAIAFYRRWGFSIAGTLPFTLGSDHQTDYVMVRRVSEPN